MGRRITTRTNITESTHAITALKNAGWVFTEEGASVLVRSGPLKGATIDLRTGRIDGNAAHMGRDHVGALRRDYGEAKFRVEAAREGVQIIGRSVDKCGDIRLKCRMTVAGRA
jgi:hypothetical protein